ncbi:hypothetical protein L7F22_004922 [Adiantum nelumboides]|nr:hypothetical protein [Adiantum nelumboides]
MSGNEPHSQALSSRSRAASTNDSTLGYGGISEKISRLNDILRSLETRRSANIAENAYSTAWPPSLHNSARLWETKAALERLGHSVLHSLCRSGDGTNEPPPSRIAEGWELQHSGSVLSMRRPRQVQCGMVDTLTGHHQAAAHSISSCIGMHDIGRLASTSGVLKGLPRTRGSVLSTPDVDFYALPNHFGCRNDEYNAGYDYVCHPSEKGYLSVPSNLPLRKRNQSTCKPADQHLIPSPVHPDTSTESGSLNVVDIAHTILARLERLEMQQRAVNRTTKLHRLSKKVLIKKLENKGRAALVRKAFSNWFEEGVARVKGDMQHAFEGQDSAKCKDDIRKHGDQEIEKRFQRLENELELCWSAINQLCIDNEHFREEQWRLTQRTGTFQQLNENHLNVKSAYVTSKSKDNLRNGAALYHSPQNVLTTVLEICSAEFSRSFLQSIALSSADLPGLLRFRFLAPWRLRHRFWAPLGMPLDLILGPMS